MYKAYYLLKKIKEKGEVKEEVKLNDVKRKVIQIFLKRFIDIIFSLIALIVFFPGFIIIAICIFVDSPGPIFFSQYRIGKEGRPFKMYKFRSMVPNAELLLSSLQEKNEVSGPMFKIKNDPRITRVGKFIRKTSIDELPQLWNVLKGEMSLVGPRPALPSEVNQYTKYQQNRLIIKPGCSGLWQVCGRSQVGFEKMIYLDLIYIREQNIFLDVVIILKTINQMFYSKTAY